MQLLHGSLLSLSTHLESGKRIGQAELQVEGEGPCSMHTLAMHGSSKKREGEGAEREAQRGSGRGGEREGVVWTAVCVSFDVARQRRLSASRSRPLLSPLSRAIIQRALSHEASPRSCKALD